MVDTMSNKSEETRKRILETAVRMLEAEGGCGVAMGRIAKASGITRQALYLHFSTRAELLTAATHYLDELLDVNGRLAPSRAAGSGVERLDLYIDCWGRYIPEIYGVAKALMLGKDTDEAMAAAWNDRMAAMRDGCRAAIDALQADGRLASEWQRDDAIDALWAMLSVQNWELLTQDCGWSVDEYVERTQLSARRAFVAA